MQFKKVESATDRFNDDFLSLIVNTLDKGGPPLTLISGTAEKNMLKHSVLRAK